MIICCCDVSFEVSRVSSTERAGRYQNDCLASGGELGGDGLDGKLDSLLDHGSLSLLGADGSNNSLGDLIPVGRRGRGGWTCGPGKKGSHWLARAWHSMSLSSHMTRLEFMKKKSHFVRNFVQLA